MSVSESQLVQAEREADTELVQQGHWDSAGKNSAYLEIELDVGTIHIELADIAISLIRSIRSHHPTDGVAQIIGRHLRGLTDWYSQMPIETKEAADIAVDRSGFLVKAREIRFPTTRF
ncbi:MAG: hypothetical protein ACLQVJ_27110 [Syntrophobacteraceae bacterium]